MVSRAAVPGRQHRADRRVLHPVPGSRVATWIVPIFLIRVPAWIWLELWFVYQLIEADLGLFNAQANGGGVAFFAHVGGFIFGLLIARLLLRAGQITPQARYVGSPL